MIWVILVGIFAVIVFFAFRKAKSYGVASNALLAEHMLVYIELVQENPFTKQLRDAVITVWQNGSNRNISEKDVIESFNRQERIVNLLELQSIDLL